MSWCEAGSVWVAFVMCGGVPFQVEVQICGRFVLCHDCFELPDECFYAKVVRDGFIVSAEISFRK